MSPTRQMADVTPVRGVVQIHSTPSALRPHIEWALGGVLGVPVKLSWELQPVDGTWRTEHTWVGRPGRAAEIASSLATWARMRFEVTELPTDGRGEGLRWSFTPGLGMFSATTNGVGDILVHELRLKSAVVSEALTGRNLAEAIDELLGVAWDAELEPFRQAADGAPVRWLHQVG